MVIKSVSRFSCIYAPHFYLNTVNACAIILDFIRCLLPMFNSDSFSLGILIKV